MRLDEAFKKYPDQFYYAVRNWKERLHLGKSMFTVKIVEDRDGVDLGGDVNEPLVTHTFNLGLEEMIDLFVATELMKYQHGWDDCKDFLAKVAQRDLNVPECEYIYSLCKANTSPDALGYGRNRK